LVPSEEAFNSFWFDINAIEIVPGLQNFERKPKRIAVM
jgi:hypothetical protein